MSGDLHWLQKVCNWGTVDARRDLRDPLSLQQSDILERPRAGARGVIFRAAQQNRALLKRVTFQN